MLSFLERPEEVLNCTGLPLCPSVHLPDLPKSMLQGCAPLESWKQSQMPAMEGVQEALAQQARGL